MINRFFLILCGLILIGCSKKISSNDVIGSWWSLQEDSTYFEVYINEVELNINHESYGPIRYGYVIINDSIFISNYENIISSKWKIEKITKSKLLFRRGKEEVRLYRLYLSNSYFDVLKDSLAYENFEQEFINRHMIRK